MFDANSRYARVPDEVFVAPDGTRVACKRLRLPPLPEDMSVAGHQVVGRGERADMVAARALGDPTLAWLLVDANGAMDPFTLVQDAGRVLIVPGRI